jgi:hypothetical protein
MNFGTAVKVFWSNYTNFKSRARRSEKTREADPGPELSSKKLDLYRSP